jgi:hypothetical protein
LILQEVIQKLDGNLIALNEERKTLLADLRDNLVKRKEEFILRLTEVEGLNIEDESKAKSSRRKKGAPKDKGKQSKDVEVINLDLEYVEKFLGEVEIDLSTIEQRIQEIKTEKSKTEAIIDSFKKDETRLDDAISEGLKSQDRLLNKRNLQYENSEHKQRLIRELGSLPRKELDQYKAYSESHLLSALKVVNEKLRSYSG